jgi:hypothetical protein
MAGCFDRHREPVTATMTPDQARLLGLEAIGEAVPGRHDRTQGRRGLG